jgi:phosphoribosylformylglycinamidine synthase
MPSQPSLVLSCHDISEGGIAAALAEMSFRNGKGCNVTIPGELSTDKILFSESGGFVLEVAPDNIEALRKIFSSRGIDIKEIGKTTTEAILKINNVLDLPVAAGKDAWESGLRDKLG